MYVVYCRLTIRSSEGLDQTVQHGVPILLSVNKFIIEKYRKDIGGMRPQMKRAKNTADLLGLSSVGDDRPTPLEFSLFVLDEAARKAT